MEPHASPNTTWFVVIEGGGWVGVGDERTRIAAGEAVLWPADLPHAAWTEHSEMRAFTIEFPGADDSAALGIIEGGRATDRPALAAPAERGEGALADDRLPRADPEAGEPA
jgi:gentisate 1,2-dioxygenase